jgi:DNA-binding response OmpR family regulator
MISRSAKVAHILIVDDEEDITELLQRVLKRSGYKVTSYVDPTKALEEFRPGRFDLALLDIRMPGINGFELLKQIKLVDKTLKACFLTAFELETDDFVQNGISEDSIKCFIKKPIHLSDFTKKVSALLEAD